MGHDKKKEQDILGHSGYICRGLLGQGAFSRVYQVEGKADGRMYACKVSSNRELLEKEAAVMAKLQHPLFPEYFRIWQETGLGCLLMEYVPGCNLEKMLEHRKRFSVKQAVHIGMELAEGLLYLHEREEGILFRDVKPANIVIRQDGWVKLLDFGCACTISEGAASRAGTPGFAAPEQLAGEDGLTAACDVYGLGQTLKAVLGVSEYKGQPWECGERREGGRDVECGRDRKGRRDREGGESGKNWNNRKNWKSRDDRKRRKRLSQILDACTRQEVSGRIPDMRGVMDALMPLYGRERRYFGQKFFSSGHDISCRKNIWESAYKNS